LLIHDAFGLYQSSLSLEISHLLDNIEGITGDLVPKNHVV